MKTKRKRQLPSTGKVRECLRVSPLVWGNPGIGKSKIVAKAAKAAGVKIVNLRVGEMEPTDLRGVIQPHFLYTPRGWKEASDVLFLAECRVAEAELKDANAVYAAAHSIRLDAERGMRAAQNRIEAAGQKLLEANRVLREAKEKRTT